MEKNIMKPQDKITSQTETFRSQERAHQRANRAGGNSSNYDFIVVR